jgi:predicted alpha/beta hydrolase
MPPDGSPDTLTVSLAGSAEVVVTLRLPPAPAAWVVCLPALGVPAAYYDPLAAALAGHGLAVASTDHRGNGTSSVRAGRGVDFGYADLVADALRVIEALRRRLDVPVHALGHSLGGQVAAVMAGHAPGCVQSLVLTACGTPYWRGFAGRTGLQVLALAHLARVTGPLLGHFPGERIGFGGREAARLMREWSSLARHGRLDAAGLDAEAAIARASAPVLFVSIDGDWMAPAAAVEHLAGKLVSAPIERVRVTRDNADPRALDHFRWARYPDAVAGIVADWVRAAP